MSSILISAGDASGELHAAALAEELRAVDPEVRLRGLGGPAMEKAGVSLVAHQEALAVGGLLEVLRDLGRIVGTWFSMVRALRDERPDLLVLVDSPDFNIPFARRAKRLGIPVLYFITPQVWAWRRGRMKKVARRVDRMAVIFPFERDIWADAPVPVDFVGHPLVDRLSDLLERPEPGPARAELGLDPDRPLVALLPGSRRNEVRSSLPMQLQAAAALHVRDPRVAFVLALAPSIQAAQVEALIAAADLSPDLRLDVRSGVTYDVLRASDAALSKPGTITVEAALLGTPMVVAARVNSLTAFIARRVVDVPSFTMPNLIAGEPVIPEYLQEDAEPVRIAEAVAELLSGEARARQVDGLERVRARLGSGGAARKAAQIAKEMALGPARS
ncbi:MAG: lipid-A-disaccharide synthase [Myxococcota bacterium]|nr:lipid-A-disaccharide synthase [Myxococcota bacterium]